MANDTILTPGGDRWEPTTEQESTQYLIRDNFLSEYETEGEKAVVRENLDVYAKEAVYNRQESDIRLDESIQKAFEKYLNEEDPHGILPIVRQMIEGFVKEDGSIPFTAPQGGVDPVQDFHLATKRFVTKILRDHINDDDPHRILPQVEDMLEQYVKQADVYFKSQLYTKNEIDSQSGKYIKKDGSTPFTKAQVGADPQIDSHLATKRYVDKVIYSHLVDVDPHGFVALLNKRLALYAKANNVYDKSQTYSRVQLDSIIRGLVNDAAREAIIDHLNEFDPHNILAEVRKERYVKQDGTIPFRAPQKGVDAIDPQDLVTYQQLRSLEANLDNKIATKECQWITSGPSEVEVGNVTMNQEFPLTMSMQEILDAIFYGKGISLIVPSYNNIATRCPVTVCIHGSLGMVEYAELFQDGKLIYSFTKEDFEETRCVKVDSEIMYADTEFTFKVTYINGAIHEETKIVKCSIPIFIGLLPKWKFGNTVTFQYLQELAIEDTINNKFYSVGDDVQEILHKYDFQDKNLKHLFAVVPISYPNLEQMRIPSQQFEVEAFDVIDMIPLQIPTVPKDIIYKIYIYRQALSSANQETIFKFEKDA